MKVYKFKCDSCGSKKCVKIDDGYKCEYCGSVQDVIIPPEQTMVVNNIKPEASNEPENIKTPEEKSLILRLFLCVFAGWFGIHKFLEGKIILGIVYIFTYGLFGIGYIIDIVRYVIQLLHIDKNGGGT